MLGFENWLLLIPFGFYALLIGLTVYLLVLAKRFVEAVEKIAQK